jgi:hypothetical protein
VRSEVEGAMAVFKDAGEFRTVFEQIFQLMNDHPKIGRRLRDAKAPHRFEITDLDMVFSVTWAPPEDEASGRFLLWGWESDGFSPEPLIVMKMNSVVATRFFQGKEHIALAIASGRVKLRGPLAKLLELAPVTRPVYPVYREWLAKDGREHLLV